ncbi:MAG: GNAT family N-acetyltransferase [Planctomycetales bacterium]|nr:GNAT family N-acetyltransferase [Planctomycetales bacterium]
MPPIQCRVFEPSDIDFALRVGAEAGWNQVAADWRRTLAHAPQGCFLATCDGQPAGTVTTTAYGTTLAWIGMMLVDPSFRRRGVATQLMNRSIQYLRDCQVQCIKLDATPAGHQVYQRLGFQDERIFHRWVCTLPPLRGGSLNDLSNEQPFAATDPPVGTQSFDRERWAVPDRAAFGADRGAWLTRLASDSQLVQCDAGYGMLRPGRLASYLGPLVADSLQDATYIVSQLLSLPNRQRPLQVFWDIPGDNRPAESLAEQLGFKPVRELIRMWLEQPLSVPRPKSLYALGDPATG